MFVDAQSRWVWTICGGDRLRKAWHSSMMFHRRSHAACVAPPGLGGQDELDPTKCLFCSYYERSSHNYINHALFLSEDGKSCDQSLIVMMQGKVFNHSLNGSTSCNYVPPRVSKPPCTRYQSTHAIYLCPTCASPNSSIKFNCRPAKQLPLGEQNWRSISVFFLLQPTMLCHLSLPSVTPVPMLGAFRGALLPVELTHLPNARPHMLNLASRESTHSEGGLSRGLFYRSQDLLDFRLSNVSLSPS